MRFASILSVTITVLATSAQGALTLNVESLELAPGVADVWVQRAVEQWYFRGRSMTPRAIRTWAHDRFGELAGYAQQHIFEGARAGALR